jgi:hypothetical protein
MDIGTFTSLFGSIKTATDIARLIKDAGITLEKAETKMKFAELIEALAEAKIQAADIQETIIAKDATIRKLEEDLAIREQVRYVAPFYWRAQGDNKDGPFCQPCYDKDHKLIRLQTSDNKVWICHVCSSVFSRPGVSFPRQADEWI